MAEIRNMQDLNRELGRLNAIKMEQEALLKEDFTKIKNYLTPSYLLRSIITPSSDESTGGHLLKNTAGLGAGILANSFLMGKSGWVMKGVVTMAVKSIVTGLLDRPIVKEKIKSLLSRFGRKGGSAAATA